ncbi:hypothetical protein SRABI106_03225 [Rahnella aquatilis]|nr:hypothetical protein SRABI106_03225 [Rahnella aquatilis]
MPCALPHSHNAGYDARGDFCRYTHFTAVIKDFHFVTVFNSTGFGIDRVNPDFLPAGRLQNIDIAVCGMGAGFVVEAEHLQRKLATFRILPAFKG